MISQENIFSAMLNEGRMRKTGTPGRKIMAVSIAAAGIIVLFILGLLLFRGEPHVLMSDPGPFSVPNINVTFSKLDKNGFHKENGYITYSEGEKKSKKGIDVSYAQKEINWNKVKAAGIDFAMIRIGFRGYESGMLNVDEYFQKNIKGAQKAGIETGVYFFSQATNEAEAIEEARFVLGMLKDFDITYPVAFDWEPVTHDTARTDELHGRALCDCALAFCKTIEAGGYRPVIYASLNLLREQYDNYDIEVISEYDLWLAEYKDRPEYPYKFVMWQYTDEGIVDGINTETDINLYYDYE